MNRLGIAALVIALGASLSCAKPEDDKPHTIGSNQKDFMGLGVTHDQAARILRNGFESGNLYFGTLREGYVEMYSTEWYLPKSMRNDPSKTNSELTYQISLVDIGGLDDVDLRRLENGSVLQFRLDDDNRYFYESTFIEIVDE